MKNYYIIGNKIYLTTGISTEGYLLLKSLGFEVMMYFKGDDLYE